MKTNIVNLFLMLASCLIFICCTTNSILEKERESKFQEKETIYEVWAQNGYEVKKLDIEPVLKGGEMSNRAVYKSFRYPAKARENGVGGRVEILVVVNEFGILESIEVAKGIGSGCDEESLKAVQNMKEIGFEPAILNGLAVKVRYLIPVSFRLD